MESNNVPTTPSDGLEQLLTAAGLTFTIVDRCPHPTCEVCAPATIAFAA